ncbi:hypothetical protein BKA70DRAFT_1442266 [Coprinopsis sp. MPI-PUGE-AT-0042]|nr:hypothetical protein BKA70DRAFT_1442266 [Coprinopsis sp. MPI-PUGE-AT-0042]
MVKPAQKLKKENVAVNVIYFADGIEMLNRAERGVVKSFVENLNRGDSPRDVISIPAGNVLLSDFFISTAVLAAGRGALTPDEFREGADAGGAGGSGGGGEGDFEFGVEPSLDSKLAMVLRLSTQDAQTREAVDDVGSRSSAAPQFSTSATTTAGAVVAGAAVGAAGASTEEKDPEHAKALALLEQKSDDVEMGDGDDENEGEDAAIARAIEMSVQGQQEEEDDDKKKS